MFEWWRMLSTFEEIEFPFWCWFVVVHGLLVNVVAWDIAIIVCRVRSSSSPKSESLSAYSFSGPAEGRHRVIGRWLNDRRSPVWSDIFHFLSVIRVIFRVVVNLGIETTSSSLIVLFAVLWIKDENLRRSWCAENTDVTLGPLVFECCAYFLESITNRSPSPWGTGHDVLVNRNSKIKKAYHPSFSDEAASDIYPDSIFLIHNSSDVTHWCMYEQNFSPRSRFFSNSAVERGQGSPRT